MLGTVRQHIGARRGGHAQRAQFPRPDILERSGYAVEVDLHLPAEQVGEPRAPHRDTARA